MSKVSLIPMRESAKPSAYIDSVVMNRRNCTQKKLSLSRILKAAHLKIPKTAIKRLHGLPRGGAQKFVQLRRGPVLIRIS